MGAQVSDKDEKDEGPSKITQLFPGGPPEMEEPEVEEPEVEEPGTVVEVDFGAGREESSGPETPFAVFSRMINQGMVMVTLDPQAEGTTVPPEFMGHRELRLNFSYRFQLPDFDFDEDGVRASLSFQGQRKYCDIPWEAVYMLFCHETGEFAVFRPPMLPTQ